MDASSLNKIVFCWQFTMNNIITQKNTSTIFTRRYFFDSVLSCIFVLKIKIKENNRMKI